MRRTNETKLLLNIALLYSKRKSSLSSTYGTINFIEITGYILICNFAVNIFFMELFLG